jgi:hypothetical protein
VAGPAPGDAEAAATDALYHMWKEFSVSVSVRKKQDATTTDIEKTVNDKIGE